MERERYAMLRAALRHLGQRHTDARHTYTDAAVLAVYLWAVVNDRPTYWACDPSNWPPGLHRGALPSQSCMSRRLRTTPVQRLLTRLERHLARPTRRPTLLSVIDGKPLPIPMHSRDRDAGRGRGVGTKARGYKIHAVIDCGGRPVKWRVTSLSEDERIVGQDLIRRMPPGGYLVGDKLYDTNSLHAAAAESGMQLIAERRYGSDRGLGHHRHHPGRLRCKQLLEENRTGFGDELLGRRRLIERYFAWLTNYAGGLTHLPPWVRRMHRVELWVRAKLIIAYIKTGKRVDFTA